MTLLWAALGALGLVFLVSGLIALARRPRSPEAPRRARSGPSLRTVWKALLLAAPIRLWALILAGPALSTMGAALTWIIWRGGWPESLRPAQLELLGWLALINSGLIAVIIVSLAMVKVEAETKLGRLSIGSAERDDD